MLVNNITSAFVHNGVPVANGFLFVYTDDTTSQLANLTFMDGKTPAPNPLRLNSNGGLGQPVLTEYSSVFCIVKNSRGAALFSYHLNGGSLLGGQSDFFKHSAKTRILRTIPGAPANATYNVFVKSSGFYHNFFCSFDTQGSSGLSSYRLNGINPQNNANNPVYFLKTSGSLYFFANPPDIVSFPNPPVKAEVELFWDSEFLEAITNPGEYASYLSVPPPNDASGLNLIKLRPPQTYEDNNGLHIEPLKFDGIGTWDVDSSRAYIENGCRLTMFDYCESRMGKGALFTMFNSVEFKLLESASIDVSRYGGLRINSHSLVRAENSASIQASDSALIEARRNASLSVLDNANINVSESASLRINNYANINVFQRASLSVSDYAHISVAGSSGLDVMGNSDLYMGDDVSPLWYKSRRKLWIIGSSALLMTDSQTYNMLADAGQQADRILAILDDAKLKMNYNASFEMLHEAKFNMSGSAKFKMSDSRFEIRESDLAIANINARIEGGNFELYGNQIKIGGSDIEFGGARFYAKDGGGLHTPGRLGYGAFVFYNRIAQLEGDYEIPAFTGNSSVAQKETFLGSDYMIMNARKGGADISVSYQIYAGNTVAQQTANVPPNKFIRLLLLAYDNNNVPIFAEKA